MNWKGKPVAVLLGLLLIHVLAHIDRNMLLGFSPQITSDLRLNNAQYGFLTGAVWVLSFGFTAMVMGSLADRFSRTRVMAFGILVWSVCTAASGEAHSFEQMVLARFFVATGEAALVPAAVSLIAEIFDAQKRSTAMGVFFVGIPLGIGLSFAIAGTLGEHYGWRTTFMLLGCIGAVITLPLLLLRDDRHAAGAAAERGEKFLVQVRAVAATFKDCRALRQTVMGFVLIHFAFAGLNFVQLWLVRERGFDVSGIARQIGGMQILFGTLGAVLGGLASDRLSRRFAGGHATVLSLMVLVCAPLMIAYRFAAPGSALFYIGMSAGFTLPLACYGPAMALIQALTPVSMRSTIVGTNMMLINVFAIAIGNVAIGALSDQLSLAGHMAALTTVLLTTDVLVALSLWFFWRAANSGDKRMNTIVNDAVLAH